MGDILLRCVRCWQAGIRCCAALRPGLSEQLPRSRGSWGTGTPQSPTGGEKIRTSISFAFFRACTGNFVKHFHLFTFLPG